MHIMVDIETLGTRPGSIIRSIGAVAFDPSRTVPGAVASTKVLREPRWAMYRNIDRASCEAVGLTADPETEAWWRRQSEAAQTALEANAIALRAALEEFSDFFRCQCGVELWCHGANFDEVLLHAAFRAVGLTPPWRYFDVRCTRTLFALADVRLDKAKGLNHHALDDARRQADLVCTAYRVLGLSKVA